MIITSCRLVLLYLLLYIQVSEPKTCTSRTNGGRNAFDWTGDRDAYRVCQKCCDQNPNENQDEVWTIFFPSEEFRWTPYRGSLKCECGELQNKLDACHKPTGVNCAWYFQCLNSYSIAPGAFNTEGNYALSYGAKYCGRYHESLDKFSPEGQAWISKTRKCLQVALAPYVNTDKTNDEIKEIAFESHTRCYVENGLCQLPPSDWVVIVNTVGDALLSEFLKTGGNVITSSAQCAPRVAARIGRWTWGKANAAVDSVKKVVDVAKSVKDAVSDGIDAIGKTVQKIDNLKKAFLGDMLPILG